jgi:hypothetical protein
MKPFLAIRGRLVPPALPKKTPFATSLRFAEKLEVGGKNGFASNLKRSAL